MALQTVRFTGHTSYDFTGHNEAVSHYSRLLLNLGSPLLRSENLGGPYRDKCDVGIGWGRRARNAFDRGVLKGSCEICPQMS